VVQRTTCSDANGRFAALLYGPDGQQLIEKVWKETLAELSFANIEGVLKEESWRF
jgi:hypothetical protein